MEPKAKPNATVKQRRDYVLGLILRIAAAASVEISEETQAVYLETLYAVSDEGLERAVKRTIREWREPSKMPTLAFILDRAETNPQLAAEAAWETLQKILYRDWHPDIGWIKPVELDPQMEYAVRQCGGLRRIHDCPRDTFNFMRRDFLAAHQRFSEEGGEQLRLSHKQAAQLLGQLQKGLPS